MTERQDTEYRYWQRRLTENWHRVPLLLLGGVLVAVIVSYLLVVADYSRDRRSVAAVGGQLDLSQAVFDAHHSYPLHGEWWFQWEKLVSPGSIEKSGPATLVDVPHSWIKHLDDGLTPLGFATYQLAVQLPAHQERLAVNIPEIGTAFRLYADTRLIASAGQVGRDAQSSAPAYAPAVAPIETDGKAQTITLTLEVSNFDYNKGGVRYALRLGTASQLYDAQSRAWIRSSFLSAIFVTVALLNLLHFTLRRSDNLPLLLALVCTVLVLRETETGGIMNLVSLDWEIHRKIDVMSFYLLQALVGGYLHASFPADFNRRIMWAFYGIAVICSGVVLVSPALVYSKLSMFYYAVSLLAIVNFVASLGLAVWRKRPGAREMLLGVLFASLMAVNDLLNNSGVIDTHELVSLGLVAFILLQSYLTYKRFVKTSVENHRLNNELAVRYHELESLTESLEEKVKARTADLIAANKELNHQASHDPLTGIANRMGAKVALDSALTQLREQQQPFCLVLMDLDNFKLLNDTLGHELGDHVLKQVSQTLITELRGQDSPVRWGGEEFMLVLPATHLAGACRLVERLRQCITQDARETLQLRVTATFGVAECQPQESIEQCLKRADLALYQGKSSGRDRVESAPEGSMV